MKKIILITFILTQSAFAVSHLSNNKDSEAPSTFQMGERPRPPREIFEKMIEACRGRTEKASCSVTVPGGRIVNASCVFDNEIRKLVCAIPPPPRNASGF